MRTGYGLLERASSSIFVLVPRAFQGMVAGGDLEVFLDLTVAGVAAADARLAGQGASAYQLFGLYRCHFGVHQLFALLSVSFFAKTRIQLHRESLTGEVSAGDV